MSYSYLFFRPLRLPLGGGDLDPTTVLPLPATGVRERLQEHFPHLQWIAADTARLEDESGWIEFSLDTGTDAPGLSLRCSGRRDCRDVVQALCDRFGWLAFDQAPLCYQPHRPPMPA